jgi:hypothetical protein
MGKSLKKVLALRKKKTPNKPPSAMDTVINTSELLEAILEQLPFLDLVIATGVNHRFRDTVRSSRILKRKLFLLPIAPKEDKRNKYGVLGGSTTQQDLLETPIQEPAVFLLPSLLENSTIPQTAHLTARAIRVHYLPHGKFLTNPPCAHLTVHFVYVCVTRDDVHIQLEGTRSTYRAKGVTLLSVENLLSQCGAVKVRCAKREKFKKLEGTMNHGVSMGAAVAYYERLYDCKMKICLPQTTLSLYANVLPQAEEDKA